MPLLENLLSPGMIERLGWMLVHFLWQAAAVALLLAVLQRLLRRAGANARYAAACGALVLMVGLPVVTMQFVEVSGPVAEAGPPLELPSLPPVEPLPVTVIPAAELPPLEMTPQEITDAAPPVPLRETIIAAVEPALPYVVLGWLAGVLGLSAWHLGGWTQLHRLKRRMAREAGPALRATLDELAAKLGVRRAVTLLESALVEVPTVLGWLRPVILIPASALTGLTPDQLRAILAHELAHIRRCDYLANILQTVVEILGFYHPAVWWISSRIRIERENCCDDLAVHVCGNSLQYARALTSLEEMRHSRSDLALAASGGSLMARIARLLGRPVVDDRRFAWLPGLIALLLVIGVIIPAAIVLASPNALPATHSDGPEPNQVLVKFSLFPSASPNKVVDLETRNLLAGILAKENLQPLREIVHADPQQNVTLGELLETWVAKKPMMPETMGVVIDVLQSRGYLQGEAMAETLADDNQAARISIGSTEMLRSPTDPTSAPRPVRLGTFAEVTPHLSQQSPDRIRLDLLTRWTQRDDPNDRSDAPIISTTEMTTSIAMLDGQCVALATENTGKSDARLYMLLVSPTKVVKPQAAHTDTTVFVEVLHKNGASEPNETQIHTDWVIAKVRTETVLDRTTRRLIGDVLAAEKPQAAKELADGGEMTLGQAIRKYAASQSLSPETGQALISLLKTLELATIQASSSLIAADGRQFELRNISGEWFMSRLLRPAQAGEEPNLIRLEYGTTIKGTARAENDASVTLDMDVWSSEPEPKADPNGLPVVRRMATSTTANVPGDRYFSLLVESPNRQGRQAGDAESLLVMVKPSITKPAPQAEVDKTRVLRLNHTTAQKAKELLPREYQQYVQAEDRDDSDADEPGHILMITAPAAVADAIQERVAELDKLPRQVLLDVRVVEMKRASLLNLGVEWSLPPLQTGGFYDGGDWTKAISIGYSADSTSKSSLLAALNQLETTGQGEIVTNPQIVALDGGTAQLRSIREEWFLMSDPSTFLPPELQNIESGTIVTMTPHFGDDNDITLDIAVEVSESLGRGRAPDLPIVTRRQAKNKVTIMNGGTVAVAGLTAKSAEQTGQTMNELAIFVTATLVPESGRVVSSLPSSKGATSSIPSVRNNESTHQGQSTATRPTAHPESLATRHARINHLTAQRVKNMLPLVYQQHVQVEAANVLDHNDSDHILTITAPATTAGRIVEIIQKIDNPPRQVLLDVRVVEIERADLNGLCLDWSPPPTSVGGFKNASWPREIQISRLPNSTLTDSLMTTLNQLILWDQGRIVSDPQLIIQDGRQAQLRRIQEEWFLMSNPQEPDMLTHGAGLEKIPAAAILSFTPRIDDNNDITIEMAASISDSFPNGTAVDLPIDRLPESRRPITIRNGGTVVLAGLPAQSAQTTKEVAIFVTAICIPDVSEVIPSHTSLEKTSLPALPPAGSRVQIHLTATLARIPSDRTLDPETAAKVFSLIAPTGDEQPAMSLDDLRACGAERILGVLAGRIADKRFQDVVQLIESKGFLDRRAEPQVCVPLGEQVHIAGGSLTLDLRPEPLDGGRGIQLDVEASVEMDKPSSQGGARAALASTPFLRGSGRVKIANERHGLLLLGGITPGTASANAEAYCLIFRAAVVSPDMPSA